MTRDDLLDRAAAALVALASDRPWTAIALRDVARTAGVSLQDLYAHAPTKRAIADWLARRFDLAALKGAEDGDGEDLHDRLFDAAMRRIEAMEPHRAALTLIHRADPAGTAMRLPRTARALLEAAGVDTSGKRGVARVAAMTAVWARVLQVWRDDEGALNRTMAELDKRLKDWRRRLDQVGVGA